MPMRMRNARQPSSSGPRQSLCRARWRALGTSPTINARVPGYEALLVTRLSQAVQPRGGVIVSGIDHCRLESSLNEPMNRVAAALVSFVGCQATVTMSTSGSNGPAHKGM